MVKVSPVSTQNVKQATKVAKQAAKAVKMAPEQVALTKPLQGGVNSVGKESSYSKYLDLMA